MANLGKVVITPKGEYVPGESYVRLDCVYYNGSSWLALQPSTGIEPEEGAYWTLLAQGFDEAGFNTVVGDRSQLPVPDSTLVSAITQNAESIANKIEKGDFGINVKDYGAKGNGIADDFSAFNLCLLYIGSKQVDLFLPSGSYVIGTNITIPSNINLLFENGAKLCPNNGITITINGSVDSGEHTIFAGEGIISGIFQNSEIYVKWFNLDETANVDCSAIIQSIINICQNSHAKMLFPRSKKYKISSPITIDCGTNSASIPSKGIIIKGNGCRFYTEIDGGAFVVNPLCTRANKGSGWELTYLEISDLTFDNYLGVAAGYVHSSAIVIGKTGYVFDGFQRSKLSNILCLKYPNSSIILNAARFLNLDNIEIRDGAGLEFKVLTNSDFCGDINISNSDFVPGTTNQSLYLHAYAPEGAHCQIRGLHFTDCVFFGSSTRLDASTMAQIGDVWFTSCAWDYGVNAINIIASGQSQIFNIYFNSPYITSYTGYGIKTQTDGLATVSNIKIIGGNISVTGTQPCILLTSVEEFIVEGVELSGSTGDCNIAISYSTKVLINGNMCDNTTATHFVSVGTSSDFMITNNMHTKPINDYSGSVNKLIANNLLIT